MAATCGEIDAVIRDYSAAGVRHIVALRGDPPGGVGERYAPHPDGYRNAADLVAGIRRRSDVEVSVSAYPEMHPHSPTVEADLDCSPPRSTPAPPARSPRSSSRTISPSAISTGCAPAASTSPSCPASCRCTTSSRPRFSPRAAARRCRTGWPERFDGLDDDAATRKLIAAAVAAEQVLDWSSNGVTDFHFYTLNRADLVDAICQLLGLRPELKEAA